MTSRWIIGGAILVGLSGWNAFYDFVWDDAQRVESKEAIFAKAAIEKQHMPFVEACYDRTHAAHNISNPKKRPALKLARICGCFAKEHRKFGATVRPSIKSGMIAALTKNKARDLKKKDMQSKLEFVNSIWTALDDELNEEKKTIALKAVLHIATVCRKNPKK